MLISLEGWATIFPLSSKIHENPLFPTSIPPTTSSKKAVEKTALISPIFTPSLFTT